MTANSVLEHIVRHLEVPTWFHVSQDASTWGIDHSLARLSNSIVRGEFGMDQAVLLRQCIRHLDNSQRIVVPTIAGDLLVLLERVGIRQALDGTITALPYRPEWLSEESNVCVDLPTLQPSLVDRRLPGEPWLLERLGTNHWKSNAQKEAAWSALCAPAGSSLLIGLPTGAGKSLVYQCCAAYETGLTVLVVPTVALGLDQLAAVRQLPLAVTSHPRLYSSGPEGEEVMRVVRAGQCRLLITSPEAIVAGRLKNVLAQCAIEGRLRRVVVDEAHIVESWGADFRIEFQLLGSLLREWRRAAPEKLRLLLLSATFAPGTLRMLKRLFASDDGLWEEHIIQRLRPEIHYFAPPNWVSKEEQLNHVQEALHYLPRPAILYVTEKKHADYWVTQLTEIGFRRLAGFHGDTAPTSRDEIMRRWRNDELDLVVATSAFGMGVDKVDVRAVVHSCYPEGIDRFYQEVGRGGRDCAPTISLLVPTKRDERVAKSMGATLLRDEQKINGRWHAMWNTREKLDATYYYRIRTDTQPPHRLGIRSYSENVRWNKRLLLLMERACLIKIVGIEYQEALDGGSSALEWAVIQALASTVELQYQIANLLSEQRSSEVNAINESLEKLTVYFRRERPICRQLRDHYGTDTVRACGSCYHCRCGRVAPQFSSELIPMATPDPIGRPLVHVVQCPSAREPAGAMQITHALRIVMQRGIARRFAVSSMHCDLASRLLNNADDRTGVPYRLDNISDSSARSVSPSETIIVLHVGAIERTATAINRRGRWIIHWVLGMPIETTPGQWVFMHEFESRSFPGPEGLNHWLGSAFGSRVDNL